MTCTSEDEKNVQEADGVYPQRQAPKHRLDELLSVHNATPALSGALQRSRKRRRVPRRTLARSLLFKTPSRHSMLYGIGRPVGQQSVSSGDDID